MVGLFSRSILGLDIGSHSIKLVEVKKTRGGPIITCAKAVSMAHEEEATDAEISKSLRKLLDMLEVRSKRVIAAVSSAEERVIMRSIFMPEMTTDVSEDAVKTGARFEAEEQDYIPYEMNHALINFDIIGEATVDDEEGLEVFLVSAHRDLITSRVQLLREVGLIPIAIDIDILAIARLLGFTKQIHDDEDIAIIDIGASKTCLCFYRYGKPYVYPHILTAGDAITSELSRQLRVSWKEAEEYKKLQGNFKNFLAEGLGTHGAANLESSLNSYASGADNMESREYTSEEVFYVLQRVLEETSKQKILEESEGLYLQLRNRFEYYEADFPKPSKIIASGGTSQLASLDEFIASRLSIPVEKISYLEKIPVDVKGDVSDIESNEPIFATAVGLALKETL